MPKGIYDRSKRTAGGGMATKTPAPASWHPAPAPLPASTHIITGRWCSACQQVRPFELFAPSTTGFGILNFICQICDGTVPDPVTVTLNGDLAERQIADLTFQLQEAERTINALRQQIVASPDPSIINRLRVDYEQSGQRISTLTVELEQARTRLAALDSRGSLRPPDDFGGLVDPAFGGDETENTDAVEIVPTPQKRKPGRPPRVPRVPRSESDDEPSGPTRPLPIRPFSERPVTPPVEIDPDEPVVIPLDASKRVEKQRQPDGKVMWMAYANGKAVGSGTSPDMGNADQDAWRWMAEHTMVNKTSEAHQKVWNDKKSKATTPELEAST